MKLLAVRLARILALVSTEELNPNGLYVFPAIAQGIVERYGFLKYPEKYEDFDEQKGIVFADGRWGNISIDRIVIFSNGITIDTRSTTKDSEQIFNEALNWIADTFGITFKPEMVTQTLYLSELVFSNEKPLAMLNPALKDLGDKISKAVTSTVQQDLSYELNTVVFSYDILKTKNPIASFRIERLEDAPFEANKYYSIAPLGTEQHIELLKDFVSVLENSENPKTQKK